METDPVTYKNLVAVPAPKQVKRPPPGKRSWPGTLAVDPLDRPSRLLEKTLRSLLGDQHSAALTWIALYLNRLSSGAARGGPFVTRELARALVDTDQRLEALTARLQALEDR